MLKTVIHLPRTVWLLGLISLANDAASEFVYPLIPLYLASVLMAGPRALGIIEGIAEATASLLKLVSGIVADRLRHGKLMVVGGYGLAALGRPLLAFASSWPIVLLLRFADRAGKGLRTAPRDALLALSITPRQRGIAFGLHRALDDVGAVIGPLLAAALLAAGLSLHSMLLWTVIPGVITVGLTLAIREPQRKSPAPSANFNWDLRAFPTSFKRYLLVLALFTLGNSSNTFLLLRAHDMGLPQQQIPLLWALVALIAALFSTPLSALSDRYGRKRLISAGWLIYGAFYLAVGLIGQAWLLWPLFAAYGLFMAATEGVEKALVADFAPPELFGTAYGWFNLTTGIMLLPASLLFGALWQGSGPLTAFAIAAGCALAATLLLIFWVGPVHRRDH